MEQMIKKIIFLIVGIVVIFYIVGGLAPTLITAAGNISESGLPLSNLFASGGVVMIIFVVGILIAIISMALKGHGKK
jgi:hypothetical protein